MLFLLFRSSGKWPQSSHSLSLIFGPAVVSLLLSHAILLRSLPRGSAWIFFLLLLVWVGDTGAYVFGRAFGRHALYPEVSPKKTIEGSLGGLTCSLGAGLFANAAFLRLLTIQECVVLSLSVGILGQLGDLFESLVKRSVGQKDSGRLLPGHGGLLDRIDSLLFAAPCAYYYTLLVVTRTV
jgi:phosphatidate cytidylyltransferase